MMSLAVLSLIVVASLCAVVGAIYAYLYFTRINPTTKGHRCAGVAGVGSACHGGGGAGEPYGHRAVASVSVDDDQLPSTHLFLFRKS